MENTFIEGKVKSVGKFGIMLEEHPNTWFNYDKSFKETQTVSKGLIVELELDSKNRIINIEDSSKLVDTKSPNVQSRKGKVFGDSSILPSYDSKQLEILRGQCYNKACDFAIHNNWDLEDKKYRDRLNILTTLLFSDAMIFFNAKKVLP